MTSRHECRETQCSEAVRYRVYRFCKAARHAVCQEGLTGKDRTKALIDNGIVGNRDLEYRTRRSLLEVMPHVSVWPWNSPQNHARHIGLLDACARDRAIQYIAVCL